ncbi:MAG TPA: hypothetical protein PLA65_02830 [Spirochaetota bacterium]|nr:hypothetical protein [Spirochaetota bacterium]HOD16374.1 hypothetical protein [Spirochaetota bacterium]HPG52364.1 hypothetical protein [Spirochaetota bacterium]HPN10967.1 hypothetical protein [Spirochaetota bacterium]
MFMKKACIMIIALLFPVVTILAGDPAGEFGKMIKDIYNFAPSKVSDEVRKAKAGEMDKLWDLVGSNKGIYLPLLRKELQAPDNNPFFYFDGSMLLLKHSTRKDDCETAAGAIARSDLDDIQGYNYFQVVHGLACMNVDVYPAVDTMLNSPDLKVFVADHVLTLGQNYSVLYCLLCMDEGVYMDRLIRRLKTEKHPETVKTIIMAIAYTVTDRGQKAIADYMESCRNRELKEYAKTYSVLETKKKLPEKEVKSKRKFFRTFLDDFVNRNYGSREYDFKEYAGDAYYLVKKEDYPRIKALRKAQAQRVSDEALGEIDFLTMLLQYSFTSGD